MQSLLLEPKRLDGLVVLELAKKLQTRHQAKRRVSTAVVSEERRQRPWREHTLFVVRAAIEALGA